jgi:SAM-dependent methyltransferase
MSEIESTYRIAGEGHKTLSDYLLFRRHLFAYETVCESIPKGQVVADVGCGYGYALEMLLDRADKVYAIDAADTALNALPDLPHTEKIKAYANAIPLADNTVDCLIAFQLLEHLPVDTVTGTLSEFMRIVRPGGKIFATTPNARWRLFPGQTPWNPYHTSEYNAADLRRICEGTLNGHSWQLKSVCGVAEAQQIERARVAPDPFKHYGRGMRGYVLKAWQRFGPARIGVWRRRGRSAIQDRERLRSWFELSNDPDLGLDLWLEVTK